MRLSFTVRANGYNWYYTLLPFGSIQTIWHDGTILLRLVKIHDHRYEMTGFIYKTCRYIYPTYFDTKSKLYGAIQKLLQEEL